MGRRGAPLHVQAADADARREPRAAAVQDPGADASASPTHEVIRSPAASGSGLHTPGHTEDHLCLFDPTEGVMLSGDHVLPTITPAHRRLQPAGRPAARLLRVARQGRRLRTRRLDRAACPRPPVRRPRRAGQGDPGAPRRAPRPAAPHDRGARPAGPRAGVLDAPVLAAGAGPDGRQRDVRPPRAPAPRRRDRAPRARRTATSTSGPAERIGASRSEIWAHRSTCCRLPRRVLGSGFDVSECRPALL